MPRYRANSDTLLSHESRVVKAGEEFTTTFPHGMRIGDNLTELEDHSGAQQRRDADEHIYKVRLVEQQREADRLKAENEAAALNELNQRATAEHNDPNSPAIIDGPSPGLHNDDQPKLQPVFQTEEQKQGQQKDDGTDAHAIAQETVKPEVKDEGKTAGGAVSRKPTSKH
jgi:hypothetical protein